MLNFRPLLFILGLFLSMLTAFMLIPLLLAIFNGEETVGSFMLSALLTGISASLCLHNGQSKTINLNIRDMFLLTSLTWLIVSLFAAMPFTTVLVTRMLSLKPCLVSRPPALPSYRV